MEDDMVQSAYAFVPSSGTCSKRLVGVISLRHAPIPSTVSGPLQILPTDVACSSIATIRNRLCERLPSYMIPALWVAIYEFPLMPSGKMDRRRVMKWLEQIDQDTYSAISTTATEQPQLKTSVVEQKLQGIFANVLNLSPNDVRLNQSFLHLGGDSIAAMQVSSQCRAHGLPISVQDIIRSKSITALAVIVDVSQDDQPEVAEISEYNLPFDISPIQRLFFETVGDRHDHFNQTEIFRLSRHFELKDIRAALTVLVDTHPMLRARFAKDDNEIWQQRVERNATTSFKLCEHRVQTVAQVAPIVDDSQMALDIVNGPTFAIDVFKIDDTFSQVIALVAHHLVIDIVSWGVLLEDLQSLLNRIKTSPQSLPYHTWLQQQAIQARKESGKRVFPMSFISPADLDYWGMTDQPNINGDIVEGSFQLSSRDTMLLLGAQEAQSTEVLDILIAGLLESFRKVFPDRSTVTIHNEGHGREPFNARQDLSRTIGWFSTVTPISLPLAIAEESDLMSTITWVKEARERIPDKGRPYFAYRYLNEDGRKYFADHWPAEAVLNYIGKVQNLDRKDSLFQSIDSIESRETGDKVPRMALFDITAAINKGAIKLSFAWNRHMKYQSEIHTWIAQCQLTLIDAIEEVLKARTASSLNVFKHLPLLYNGPVRLAAALPPSITIMDVEDLYPTSPMQQGILHAQSRDHTLYIYDAVFEVQSSTSTQVLEPHMLAEAWQIVVHRHPALRTIFVESLAKDGSNDQIVLKAKVGRVQFLPSCTDIEVASILRSLASIDGRDHTPPHRMSICQTASGKVWVKLELSHAINDGTSISNILKDLARAYEKKLTRADVGPPYSDYIAHISSGPVKADMAYWKNYLDGIEPCLFPTLTDGKTYLHKPYSIDISLGNTQDIHRFCKGSGVTLSNVLQLAWALTLHCFVGTFDVSFGLIASGRDVPLRNVDDAVGCFVNMLITRLTFSDDTLISQLLQDLQSASTNALSHQSCPLAEIQHESLLPALFNTAFTFQRRAISRDPEEIALLYENMEAADGGEYAVTLNTDVNDEDITAEFGFWKDKISPSQAQNIAETFEVIFDNVVASHSSTLTVGQLDVFTPSSRQQVMEWNSEPTLPIRRCVHDVIHEQAVLRPRSTKAIEGWDGAFTYQEFDKLTDQLACHLQVSGITTETFVPILFEKSSWAIVSMIAIMKAGGAYVPLDPKHPQTRLRDLIDDVGAKIILCSRGHYIKACGVADSPMIIDQQAIKEFAVSSDGKPKSAATPDNASYCLFTSGTTGKPKGTIIPHQAFCTSAAAFTRRMNINATSRTFQFASYTFDASCIEILSALTVGATVCVPSDGDRMNDLAGSIRKLKANWSLLTPSVLGTIEPDRVPSLKTLVSGGEVLPGTILRKWGTSICFINGTYVLEIR